MRALLEVNVLFALLDADHSLHTRATNGSPAMPAAVWRHVRLRKTAVCAPCRTRATRTRFPCAQSWVDLRKRALATSMSSGPTMSACSLRRSPTLDAFMGRASLRISIYWRWRRDTRGRFVTFDGTISIDAVCGAEKTYLVIL